MLEGGVPISPQEPPQTTLGLGVSGTTYMRTLLVLKAWHCQDWTRTRGWTTSRKRPRRATKGSGTLNCHSEGKGEDWPREEGRVREGMQWVRGWQYNLSCPSPHPRRQLLVSGTQALENHEIVKRFYSNSYNYSACCRNEN